MKTFKFAGYSDDTFGEFEVTNNFFDNCSTGEPIQYELKTPEGVGVVITGMYSNSINKGDGWMIGVNVIDEHKPVIDWRFRLEPSYERYQNLLIVEAPVNSELTCLTKESEDGWNYVREKGVS